MNQERIFEKYNLKFKHQFTAGNSGALVLACYSSILGEVVLKLPTNERSREEIVGNIRGYECIKKEKLDQILPEVLIIDYLDNEPFIIMSDLGDNFMSLTKNSKTSLKQYQELCDAMKKVYSRSLKNDDASKASLEKVLNLLLNNYQTKLSPEGLISFSDINLIKNADSLIDKVPAISSFACFDFTPEDIFLPNGNFKYPDPKHEIRGLPIIDLACFAGVSLDSYNLPASIEGYTLIENFAVNEVAEMFKVETDFARKVFQLGRALQLSFSAKVRIKTDPSAAKKFSSLSVDYLKKVYD